MSLSPTLKHYVGSSSRSIVRIKSSKLERAKKSIDQIDAFLVENVGSERWSGQRLNDFLAKVLVVLKSKHVAEATSIQADMSSTESIYRIGFLQRMEFRTNHPK